MSKWYDISGANSVKVKTALRVLRYNRNLKTRHVIRGRSFRVFVPEEDIPSLKALAKKLDLRVREVAKKSPVKPEPVPDKRRPKKMPKDGMPVTPAEEKKVKKERPVKKPSKKELLALRRRHTLKEIGEKFGVSLGIVRRWLKEIPESKNIRIAYTCSKPGCGKKFTGRKARWLYGAHLRHAHSNRLNAQANSEETDRTPAEFISLKAKIASFDREISRLEAEYARLSEELYRQKTAREEYISSILAAIGSEKR